MVGNIKIRRKRRAMTSEKARSVKLAGHEVEKEFAELIGGKVYIGTNKKDVLDRQGNIHSVKSGALKWQIFLYGRKRFDTSIGFLGAKYFIKCIDSFPLERSKYNRNKEKFKLLLQGPMLELRDFLNESGNNHFFIHSNKMIFLQEAIFHSSEVNYLTIKMNSIFNIFDAEEVIKTISSSISLLNSKAHQKGQMDNQKVIFRIISQNHTIGEIEMRNESDAHYRQLKFWLDKRKTFNLLAEKIAPVKKVSKRIITYGRAIRKFKL